MARVQFPYGELFGPSRFLHLNIQSGWLTLDPLLTELPPRSAQADPGWTSSL